MEERRERGKGHIAQLSIRQAFYYHQQQGRGLKHRKEIGNGHLTKHGWKSQCAVCWEGRCLGSPEYILRYPVGKRLLQSDECS